MLYRSDFVREVLELYIAGVSILDIANFTGSTVEEVNEVIDSFSPYM